MPNIPDPSVRTRARSGATAIANTRLPGVNARAGAFGVIGGDLQNDGYSPEGNAARQRAAQYSGRAQGLAAMADGVQAIARGVEIAHQNEKREEEELERKRLIEEAKKLRAAEKAEAKAEREAEKEGDRQRRVVIANAVAQSDFTGTELAMRQAVGATGEGYTAAVLEAYDAFVDERAELIDDDEARDEYRIRMASQRGSLASRAMQYEFGSKESYEQVLSDQSLVTLDNRIRATPDQYDALLGQGFAVIDTLKFVPEGAKVGMRAKWRETAALSSFEGRISAATTLAEAEAVRLELLEGTDTDWREEFSPAGYDRALGLVNSAITHMATQADATARAAVSALEDRSADPTTIIPDADLYSAQQLVAASQNAVTQARMARVVRNQAIIKSMRMLTPQQQRSAIEAGRALGLPSRVNNAIAPAAAQFGVDASYLAATVEREYGQQLQGPEENIDYGQGNAAGASNAVGVMQFIPATWLRFIKRPDIAQLTGVTAGMSDAELLELRKNPEISILVGAAFAAENKGILTRETGRVPSNAELYMAHFLGAGGGPVAGAAELINAARDNPVADAVAMFPLAAAANPTIFKNAGGKGSNRTVRQVYNELGRRHATEAGSETQVQYDDRKVSEDVLAHTQKALASDPMQFAESVGVVTLGSLTEPGGLENRAQQVKKVADYYGLNLDETKPFTETEATQLSQTLRSASAEQAVDIIASIQQMGPEISDAALTQVAQTDPVYAYAGGLGLHTGTRAIPADIIRGQKQLAENPSVRTLVGATPQDLIGSFSEVTGGALLRVEPEQRQSIMDAALAHYVQTHVLATGGGDFDSDAYEASVNAVLTGRSGMSALADVNGHTVLLPQGMTEAETQALVDVMTIQDWMAISVNGGDKTPRYRDGTPVSVEDMRDVRLNAIGGNTYTLGMDDGTLLVTSDARGGSITAFMVEFNADVGRKLPAQREAEARAAEQAEIDAAERKELSGQAAEAFEGISREAQRRADALAREREREAQDEARRREREERRRDR